MPEKIRSRVLATPLRKAGSGLALAQRRVWDAQKIVAEQKKRIGRLRAAGSPIFDAVQALSAFESNLRLFTEHRDALLSVKRRRR
jgi:hypothetical protein